MEYILNKTLGEIYVLSIFIVIISQGITDKGMSVSQGFAAGVMLAVSMLDILPESFAKYYVYMNGYNAFKAVASLFVTGWIMGIAVSKVALPDFLKIM